MDELHQVGAHGDIEGVGEGFLLEGLLEARRKSWEVFDEIRHTLQEGMTEIEGRECALDVFRKHGANHHWHKPWVRIGPGTTRTFHDPPQGDHRLTHGDLVYMDLGPIWEGPRAIQYEGDVGDSFVFGSNAEAQHCVLSAQALWKKGHTFWLKGSTGCALYDFLNQEAKAMGYQLLERIDGHRLSDYPHIQYSKERLSRLEFAPKAGLWILEFQIVHPTLPFGAFIEDVLLDSKAHRWS